MSILNVMEPFTFRKALRIDLKCGTAYKGVSYLQSHSRVLQIDLDYFSDGPICSLLILPKTMRKLGKEGKTTRG